MPIIQFILVTQKIMCAKRTDALLALEKLGKPVFAVILGAFLSISHVNAEDVILRHSFAGNISFELTGNTLRSSRNTCRAINGGSSSGTISLPNNSTIKAAYLYWSGSGEVDNQVTFNRQSVNSDVSYIEVFDSRNYFSAKADVTHLVSSSRSTRYTVSGVTFDGSQSYCGTKGAYAGWALAVIYENTDEPLRVINVFDGFKSFWGEHFSLVPNNFVIAANPATLGGKHAHITWEGDESNSQSKNGEIESLTFENNNLTDNNNPSNNQFNGYSNVTGSTSGVDIDEYLIGHLLSAGDTSVHTRYSSGQDAVFLSAELISVPNEPVADLMIQQSGPSHFIRGQTNNVNLVLENRGPNNASSNSQVTITLPTGVSLSTFSGANWNCSETTNTLSCNYLTSIANGTTSTSLQVTLNVAATSADSINLVATVTGIEFDNILSNNTSSQNYAVLSADLTNSSKTVADINGGNVQPGDTLRYQINLTESQGIAASSISVTDHLPEFISSFNIVSLPSGASFSSDSSPAGNNGTGLITFSDIDINPNSTVAIVIDAVIKVPVANDSEITNTATIRGTGITDILISSPTVYLSQPIDPATGNKPLYLHQASSLSRLQPTSSTYTALTDLAESTWIISPAFQKTFKFSGSTVNTYLFLQNNDTYGSWGHEVTLTLLHNGTSIGSVQRNITVPSTGITTDSVALFEFSIPLPNQPIIQTGDTLAIKIHNNSDYSQDSLHVYSIDPDINITDSVSPFSLVSLPAATVINVDEISVIDSLSSQAILQASPSQALTIEAQVSDPFGSFDISSAAISIKDSNGVIIVNQQVMSLQSDSGIAEKVFQYSYSLPADASIGDWEISVTAYEGVENEISHRSEFLLNVITPLPTINIKKSVSIFSDPVHGESSSGNYSKALPGAVLTYTLEAANTGLGAAQNNSIWISDSIPSSTYMLVKDFDGIPGTGPISEQLSPSPSGLSYNFISLGSESDDIEFSNNNGTNYSYSPIPDSEGIDKNITHFRINPKGSFLAPSGTETATQFTLKFRVQLQ